MTETPGHVPPPSDPPDGARRRRREPPLWRVVLVLAVIAAVPAAVLAVVWRSAADDATPPPTTTTTTTTVATPEPTPVADTALLSLRRVPGPTARALADDADRARLAEAVAAVGLSGCAAVHVSDELEVEANGSVPLVPASNQKLLTAAVALDVLGADHRFPTVVRAVEIVDGVVPGDLFLVGGGDPVLVTADVADPQRYPAINTTSLDELADQVAAAGITAVQGAVVGDGTRYDDEFGVPTWEDGIFRVEAGPYDALMVNDGLILNGGLGVNPNQSAADELVRLLRARGITVERGSSRGLTPPEATLEVASVESVALPGIVEELLVTSDDNTGELLLKEIGVAAGGGGARLAGAGVVVDRLGRWGADTSAIVVDDGSGLSRENRLTCDAIVDVLVEAGADGPLADALPVAGRTGTLEEEFVGTSAEGVVRAKSGTLTGVKALSGFAPVGPDGSDQAAFAVILNADDAAERLPGVVVGIVDALAELPTEPDPGPLGPR